jgi:hypothetical protein
MNTLGDEKLELLIWQDFRPSETNQSVLDGRRERNLKNYTKRQKRGLTIFRRYVIIKLLHKINNKPERRRQALAWLYYSMNFVKGQEDKLSVMRYNAKYRRIIEQKNICNFVALNWIPRSYIKKISKNLYQKTRYIRNDDGEYIKQLSEEVFDMAKKQPDENGVTRNKRGLRHIFNELRYLINANFYEQDTFKQLFITLTYAENMQDTKRLDLDLNKFFKRLKHNHAEHELCYIAIIEPQERGAWHVHLLLKTLNKDSLYIHHEAMEKLWGHGATRTERLSCDNIGSYFIAYLSNAELSDAKIKALEIPANDIKEKDGKKYIKGKRLKRYPDYMKIYRNSRNVKKPNKHKGNDGNVEAMEIVYPDIEYQHIKEIETEKKILVIGKEQRRKEKNQR